MKHAREWDENDIEKAELVAGEEGLISDYVVSKISIP